ncbi:hypothetical protein ACIQ4Z_10390 [Peribacillus asahii]|uniref:hypothetical protein n=1 Tax=Peribacillus asahii TaxID=228899 RepID=UPI0038027791
MQSIQNNYRAISYTAASSSQPNVGDVLQVSVKERVSNQEAVVSMRGTTATVQFEGNVPKQDQVFVEITGKTSEGNYMVKLSDKAPSTSATQPNMSQSADSELNEIVKAFSLRGISLTKDQVNVIKEFTAKGSGTAEQKLETLRVMAQKQIPVTDHTMKSIHEALNGKPLSASLMSLLGELDVPLQSKNTSVSVKSMAVVRTEAQREPNVAKSIQIVEDFLKNIDLNEVSKKKLEQSISEAKKLSQAGQMVQAKVQLIQSLVAVEKQINSTKNATAEMTKSPSEAVQSMKEKVALEPNIVRALEQVKEIAKNANLPTKVIEKLDKVMQEVARLAQTGQSVQAKAQLTQSLAQIEQDLQVQETTKPTEVLNQLKDKIMQETNVSKAIEQMKEAMKIPGLSIQAIKKLEQAIQEAMKLQAIGRDAQAKIQLTGHLNQLLQSLGATKVDTTVENKAVTSPMVPKNKNVEEAIRNLVKEVQKDPSLAKVLDRTAALLAEQGSNEELNELEKAYDQARQLQENGRELAARRELSNALSKVEQSLGIQQPALQEDTLSQVEQYAINEAVQTLKLDSQNVMVTEITKKLSQMAIDFKNLKREITKNLDNISKMLENRNILPQANVKQILESTIHKLDNAILKGDYLLYTDMSTEKKMLAASSQLAEAKQLLVKGDISEANKIVKEVKGNIEGIVFKPSDVKVKHFISEKFGLENFSSARQMASTVEEAVQPFMNNESSARQMYDTIRRLGLTHENDAGYSFVSKNGTPVDQQQTENLKATLLKMMKNEEMKPQLMQQVEQAVNNITGQQLLNKQDSSGVQNLFFQLPYMIEKQVENIKIYVNSRKDGEKVDWENCSIYFVLETKRLGDIGVLLSSSEKNVSLTFRSNKERLTEKVANLTEVTQERFREIGYQLNMMDVKPLNEPTASMSSVEEERFTEKTQLTPTFTEKGYDFSI